MSPSQASLANFANKNRVYWQKINRLAAELPEGDVWIVSVENSDRNTRAGHVSCVDRKTAAKSIVDRTHELANPEQIAGELAASKQRLSAAAGRDLRRAQQTGGLQNASAALLRALLTQESPAPADPEPAPVSAAPPPEKVKAGATFK